MRLPRSSRAMLSESPVMIGNWKSSPRGRSRMTPCASIRASSVPLRRKATGVRSVISTRMRLGKMRWTLADSTQDNSSMAARRASSGMLSTLWPRSRANCCNTASRLTIRLPQYRRQTRGDRTTHCAHRTSCGESRPAFDGAGSAARLRGASRGGTNPSPPRHCATWSLRVPNHYLVLEFYIERLVHAFANVGDQRQHVFCRGRAGVDKEIGVAIADARIADVESLQAKFVDHAPGGGPRRILEDAAGAFLPQRLT